MNEDNMEMPLSLRTVIGGRMDGKGRRKCMMRDMPHPECGCGCFYKKES